jgi:hypothetical protein
MSIPSLSLFTVVLLLCGLAKAIMSMVNAIRRKTNKTGLYWAFEPAFTAAMPADVVMRSAGLLLLPLRFFHHTKKGMSKSNIKKYGCAKDKCCQSSSAFIFTFPLVFQ